MPQTSKNNLTPRQIVEELDQYIIGQENAKKQLAVAYRNKWRRSQINATIQKETTPTNILIIGPTGSGKTECARRLANINKAPFIKVEAPRYTERGYVGGDVNEMIRGLADNAYNIVKKEKQQQVKVTATRNVEETILDTLIPRAIPNQEDPSNQEAKEDINKATRERFRKKLRNGDLNNYKIDIQIHSSQNPINAMGFVGGALDESAMMNLENIFNKIMPKSSKKKKVTIQEAKKMLLEEEMNNLLDPESIKEETVKKTQSQGIVFIDEIDKVANNNSQKSSNSNVSREGVQRDLLPIVEGTTVNTKYGPVQTDHILFIAAGAFHIAQPADLLPEIQGRFPIRVKLESLTEKHFERILKEPNNSLIKQYQALLQAEEVDLTFTQEAITTIAHIAFQCNQEMQNIGARRLRTVLNHLLSEILFNVPDQIKNGEKIIVDNKMVRKRLLPLIEKTDQSKYIL